MINYNLYPTNTTINDHMNLHMHKMTNILEEMISLESYADKERIKKAIHELRKSIESITGSFYINGEQPPQRIDNISFSIRILLTIQEFIDYTPIRESFQNVSDNFPSLTKMAA